MNKSRKTAARFAGFWCKKCGGRVLEEEPYRDSNSIKTAVLKCVLCAHEAWCPWDEYVHLLKEIERAILKKNKATKRQAVLSQAQ